MRRATTAGDQEILLQEIRQRFADAVLVARDDRGVRDGEAERVAEQGRHREPVGKAADHRGFGERFHVAERGIGVLERASRGKTAAMTTSRPVATTFIPCAPGCAGLKRERAPLSSPCRLNSRAGTRVHKRGSFGRNGVPGACASLPINLWNSRPIRLSSEMAIEK